MQGGERLAELVVQIGGQPPALLLDARDEPAAQMPDLLLGLAAAGDIAQVKARFMSSPWKFMLVALTAI